MNHYSPIVLQHFFNPQNVGELSASYDYMVHVQGGSESIGEKVVLHLGCDKHGNVQEIRYKVFGNPYMIALMSYISTNFTPLSLADLAIINYQDLIKEFAIPTTKRHCALLAVDVVQRAVGEVKALMRC